MTPAISIVVPTFNRRDRLLRVMNAIAAQSFPPERIEVVVVSDGSTDGSADMLAEASFPFQLRVIEQANAGPAAARNAGVDNCSGPIVLFIDDDVVPEPGLVTAHLGAHERHGHSVVVIGPMLTPADTAMSPWVQWEQTMLYKQYRDMESGRWEPTARQFYTGNASLPRTAFIEIGGFDTTFRRAEDVELAYRLADAGYRFVFESDARANHYAERSFESWLAIASAYGRSDAVMGRDLGQPWLLEATREEFHRANPLTRGSVQATLGRPRLCKATRTLLRYVSRVASAAHVPAVSRYALSGIYNLSYYHAYIAELGSPESLLAETDVNSS